MSLGMNSIKILEYHAEVYFGNSTLKAKLMDSLHAKQDISNLYVL